MSVLLGSPSSYRSLNFLFCPIGTPTVTVPDPTYSVNRGSAITLECSYSANPPATQVRWRKNNVDLGDTAGNAKYGGSTTASASLIIYNAAESDEGSYQCTVTNTVGTGISTTTTLDVVGSKYCFLVNIYYYTITYRHRDRSVDIIYVRDIQVRLYLVFFLLPIGL